MQLSTVGVWSAMLACTVTPLRVAALTWEIGDLRLTDLKPGDVVRHQVPLPVTDPASGNDSGPGQIEVQVAWDQLTLLIDPCPVGFDLPVRLTASNGAHAHSEHVVHVPPSRQI